MSKTIQAIIVIDVQYEDHFGKLKTCKAGTEVTLYQLDSVIAVDADGAELDLSGEFAAKGDKIDFIVPSSHFRLLG